MTEHDRFVRARRLAKGEERCRARADHATYLLGCMIRFGMREAYPATADMIRGEYQKWLTLAHRCHVRRREVLGGAR